MLVKAMPNPSRKYGETVCCAGIDGNGAWKRLFPVRYRQIETKFNRWDWVSFGYRPPTGDNRPESCHVYEDRIAVDGKLTGANERAALVNPLIVTSTAEAAAKGKTLTLIRPQDPRFRYRPKPANVIEAERAGYKLAARQTSMLDPELDELEPSPYSFVFSFSDAAGSHTFSCGDWETHATFWKHRRLYGEQSALAHLSRMYNDVYPAKGMVFAMGTVKARPKQWLLLGVLRVDQLDEQEARQGSFTF